ncbi:hypothetical protein UF13_15250 [Pantoea agglomerans]|uniref:hypothetical protein n=1 Tax=Enterobacter agglomerans TaxID=549 RepID=UPI0005DC60CC|nr:hypothetical protein [Pantoea agglomerans]KJH59144.1 hypothetical protein UF13_15250 [Pantoea agglomerans]
MNQNLNKSGEHENFEKMKWWCGTVVIGAVPLLIRFAFYFFSNFEIDILAIPEIVCFGFGIQISVIFSNIQAMQIKKNTTNYLLTTISVVFIIIFSIFYALSLIVPSPLNNFNSSLFLLIVCLISLFIGHVSVKNAIIDIIDDQEQSILEGKV